MLGISRIFVILSRGAASAERIEKVLALDEREKLEEHPAGDPAFAVEFKDVSFSYGGDKEHLTGISFALNKGASLGIIGPTGCGKSTVVNLLLRLYDVSAGAVYVDGQDVRSLPSEKLRKKFGVVFQNGYLMAASIRENIDFGRDLPEEAIIRAARCAQAEEFIKELPEGYGHDLAQKAGDLSGGAETAAAHRAGARGFPRDRRPRRQLLRARLCDGRGAPRGVAARVCGHDTHRCGAAGELGEKLRSHPGARKRQRDGRGHT